MVGIARAMSYLHAQSPPILQRDLKPENGLLMDDMQPKLSDFGSAREAAMLSSTMIGTPLFAAPEVLGRQKYGLPCDVWSYGCLVACIITRSQYPYPKELLLGVNFAALSASVTSGMLCPGLPPRQSSPSPPSAGCAASSNHRAVRPSSRSLTPCRTTRSCSGRRNQGSSRSQISMIKSSRSLKSAKLSSDSVVASFERA